VVPVSTFAADLPESVRWTLVNEGFISSRRYTDLMLNNLTVVQRGSENVCGCPFCGGRASLYFKDEDGLWICFKCGEGGNAKKLVELLEGTYVEPEMELAELNEGLRELSGDTYEPERASVPESMLLRYSHRTREPHRKWLERGFDKEACDRWELGFDPLADKGGALTLPFRSPETRHLDGIIFRHLEPGSGPRYRFPKGFARNRSLYGSWLVESPSVDLVEGPTDAVRVSQAGITAVSQYGSSTSVGQTRLLHRLGVQSVVLFFDYDRAGLRATEKAVRYLADEFDVYRVRWSRKRYCWHGTVCGCRTGDKYRDVWIDHTSSGNCPSMRKCRCGRVHEPDPCSLELEEIRHMHTKAVEV
jgi:Toprim domain